MENNKNPLVTMKDLESLGSDNAGFHYMTERIYRSEKTVPVLPFQEVGTDSYFSEDMVAVAVKVKVDETTDLKVWNHFTFELLSQRVL